MTGPPRDWTAIRAAVVAGLSTRAAAARFGVAYGTLRKRAEREGWIEARAQLGREVVAETDAAITSAKVASAKDACTSADRVGEKLEEAVEHMAAALSTRASTLNHPGDEKAPEPSPADLRDIASAIHSLAGALQRGHATRRLALGLDKGAGSEGDQSALENVLRRLELSGEIAPTTPKIDPDAGVKH